VKGEELPFYKKEAVELAEKNRISVSRSAAIRMLVERGVEHYWEKDDD